MTDITVEKIIKEAKKRRIDLGTDPAKTIRFYTKLGFIPKPRRKKVKSSQRKKDNAILPGINSR
jgi:hypothetical protein